VTLESIKLKKDLVKGWVGIGFHTQERLRDAQQGWKK